MPPRHRTLMDYESMATTMEADPLKSSQIDKARLVVVNQAMAKFPEDDEAAKEWAKEMMLMLGIHSSQDDDAVPTLPPQGINANGDYKHYGVHPVSV